jgi:hypothetical protein
MAVELNGIEFAFDCALHKITKSTTNVIGILKGGDPKLSRNDRRRCSYDHLGRGEFASLGESPGKESIMEQTIMLQGRLEYWKSREYWPNAGQS